MSLITTGYVLLVGLCVIFFFFQAEDGIRDKLVTGVQTCALPICAVDRDVDRLDVVGREQFDAEAARERRRRLGGRHAAHVEAGRDALGERAHEGGGGVTRAQADDLAARDVTQGLGGQRRRAVVRESGILVHAATASLRRGPSSSAPRLACEVTIRAVTPDASDPIEELFARGVTDGLPVVPPTAERVGATVAASGRGGDELIGLVAPANGRATVERVAVNAVMAGCRPEYIPVVIAAVSAICDPEVSLVGVSGTTDAGTPLVLVNGPIRRALEVNCAGSVVRAGFRANATIGRAVRLVWVNVGGARPGVISMSTFGQPGRYSYCIGEHEEASPWEPLSVEHGFAAADSTVAVLAAEAPQIVVNAGGRRA